MKIAMIGSGAAGSVFAGYLRRGGADITLVDPYKEHMEKIARDGLSFVIYPDQEYQVTGYKTALTADEIGLMDIVIFMTKATQLESAIATAAPCIGPETVLVSLLNGIGNEDKLTAVVGGERVIYGSGVLGTALDGPGRCISSPGAGEIQMNFGAYKNSPLTERAGKHLEKCFIDGGCPTKFWEDVRPALWTKVVVNCTFNPLCALTRLKVKDLLSHPGGVGLVIQVVTECCAIATAKGCPMNPQEFMMGVKQSGGSGIMDYYPSMAQDMLMFKRQTEIGTLNGAISAYGKELGIPTPGNDFITNMVSVMQANYDKQYREEK